jgi:hypothetical protein
VPLTPVINIHVRISQGIIVQIRNGPHSRLRGPAGGKLINEKTLSRKSRERLPLNMAAKVYMQESSQQGSPYEMIA